MMIALRIFILCFIFAHEAYAMMDAKVCEEYYEACQFIYKLNSSIDYIAEHSKSKEEAYNELKELVSVIIDSQYLSRFVMGIYWNSSSLEERRAFTREYGKYIVKMYANYLYKYAEYDFDILSIKKMKDNTYSINVRLINDNDEFISLEFKFLQVKESFYLQDLKINSTISIMVHQRSKINDMISEKGLNYTILELSQENFKLNNR